MTSPTALQRAYGPAASNAVALGLARRHNLRAANEASALFNRGQYNDCAEICRNILAKPRLPAEAIQARCHMFLAVEGVEEEKTKVSASEDGGEDEDLEELNELGKERAARLKGRARVRAARSRLQHAEAAVRLWDVVVDRRGESRFPVEKARVEREEADALLEAAQAGLEEAEAAVPDEESGSEDGEVVQAGKTGRAYWGLG